MEGDFVITLTCCVSLLGWVCVTAEPVVENTDPEDTRPFEIFPRLPIAFLKSKNEKCRQDSESLLENLRNSTTWAMKMLESSARSGVGVLSGGIYQMGDYDECVQTVYPIRSRYCMATLTMSKRNIDNESQTWDFYVPSARMKDRANPPRILNNKVFWALCVPASCSPEDVQASLQSYLAVSSKNTSDVTISVQIDAALCRLRDEDFSYGTMAYCIVWVVIVLLVTSSTVLSCYGQVKKRKTSCDGSTASEYFLLFSVQRNISALFSFDRSREPLILLHAIRVLLIFLVVTYHRVSTTQGFPVSNFATLDRALNTREYYYFVQGALCVDTFFVFSAMLLIYIYLEQESIHIWEILVQRFLRFTPVYMMLVFFCSTLMYNSGDGPLWNSVIMTERDNCREIWWIKLLYISNYVSTEKYCMLHSWFLQCEMHFFIFGLLVLKILRKSPKAGLIVLGCATFLCAATSFVITYIGKKDPMLFVNREFIASLATHDYLQTIYIKSHTHAVCYTVGITAGFLIHKKIVCKEMKTYALAGLLLGSLISVATLFWGLELQRPDWEYDVTHASFAAAFRRLFWALGQGVFAVSTHYYIVSRKPRSHPSVKRESHSSSVITALSKLSLNIYLVHFVLQTMHFAAIRTPQHVSGLSMSRDVLADYASSVIIALLLFLTVESPVMLIYKKIISTKHEKEELQSPAPPSFNYVTDGA